MDSVFKTLSSIDITEKLKAKNGMNYLPWSSAWYFVKSLYPLSTYSVVKDENGNIYHTDGKTCWVETYVTIEKETQFEYLPVLNYKNLAIPLETVTLADVNKSIKRCLTKNCALFGLGLNLWNGEELSDDAKIQNNEIKAVNEESLAIATELAQKSDELKKQVGELCAKYTNGKKNPMVIKNIDKAKELNEQLKSLK